jgi:hypothetical protein
MWWALFIGREEHWETQQRPQLSKSGFQKIFLDDEEFWKSYKLIFIMPAFSGSLIRIGTCDVYVLNIDFKICICNQLFKALNLSAQNTLMKISKQLYHQGISFWSLFFELIELPSIPFLKTWIVNAFCHGGRACLIQTTDCILWNIWTQFV